MIIDPGTSSEVLHYVDDKTLTLEAILLTHHHTDHTGGVIEIAKETGCRVYGNKKDSDRLPGLTHAILPNAYFSLQGQVFEMLPTPGHTIGHVAYYSSEANICFVGDTLFSMGCGRVFEGTLDQMWLSLQSLRALPDDTQIYCAHEYTLDNIKFVKSFDKSESVLSLEKECQRKREKGRPTIPFRLGDQKSVNPFLAVADESYRESIGMQALSSLEAFAQIRIRKK